MLTCGKCKRELKTTEDCSLCAAYRELEEKLRNWEPLKVRLRGQPFGAPGLAVYEVVNG